MEPQLVGESAGITDAIVIGWVIGVIVYIILCSIIASKATDTNRSGAGYFFLSLFLSPFVGFMTLHLSMLAKIELSLTPALQQNAKSIPNKDTWTCAVCQHENPNTTFKCEQCKVSLK